MIYAGSTIAFKTGSAALDSFISRLIAGEIGADSVTFRRYLDILQDCVDWANSAASGSGGRTRTGGSGTARKIDNADPAGLLVSRRDDGKLQMLPFEGFAMLRELQLSVVELHPDIPSRSLGL